MDATLKRLVDDVAAATGADLPAVTAPDAPVPRELDHAVYFVGLIGGKEVGKSSLVNALVGRDVVTPSAFGRGTSRATAYCHHAATPRVKTLLSAALGNRFDVVTHDIKSSRVLLDLPDVDSVWDDHIEITRTLLRLMLYPIWVQSVEKYADRQPLELLKQVAAGNDPQNFLFVLNKVDQVAARYGTDAVTEIVNDYAPRLQAACGLASPPRVYSTDARDREAFALPELIATVTKEKSAQTITRDRTRAEARQSQSALAWIDDQRLPMLRDRTRRLLDDAREQIDAQLVAPLVEESIPRLLAEPAHRMALAEPITRVRLARWPVVNVIDAVAIPIVALVRANLARPVTATQALDDSDLAVAPRVRGIFARLAQADPAVFGLYGQRKLWEQTESLAAAADVNDRVRSALDRQRRHALDVLAGRTGFFFGIWRVLLTIGAIVWFPVVQPVLEIILSGAFAGLTWETLPRAAVMLVRVLSATYLLQSLTLLSLYFVVLWLVVRWGVYWRVESLMRRLRDPERTPEELNPAAAVLAWSDDLLAPLKRQYEKTNELVTRTDAARAA